MDKIAVRENISQWINDGKRRHDYIYEDIMEKNGYYECDRMGEAGFYSKISEERTNEFDHDFCIVSKNDWCFWFRVYSINNGYRIEDFLGDEAMN